MIIGRIAVVGSTNRLDVQTQSAAKAAAYHLGWALATKRLPILVYDDKPIFVEAEVVRGYLASGQAAVNSIEVRYPEKLDDHKRPNPPPFKTYFEEGHPSFLFQPDRNAEWEISFYQSLETIGGMVIFQGGSSTLIAGVIALGYNKPVLSCSGFGGMAVKLTSVLAEKGAIAPEEKARLELRPGEAAQAWAKECVEILLKQAEKIESKRQQQAINVASVKRRQTVHTLLAASMAAIALILCIVNWDNSLKFPPVGVLVVIFIVAGLSGATGAMLRSIVPFLRTDRKDTLDSPWGTVALGLIVGLVSTLIYLVAQEHGFPELKGTVPEEKITEFKADYFAQLIPFAMITALVAGMTLDSTFKSFLKRRLDEA